MSNVKEAFVAYINLLCHHSPEENRGKSHGIPRSDRDSNQSPLEYKLVKC
jgi:hypothetical protein